MIMDINQPFVTQEQKFKYWEESKDEIQTLRAQVASADVLLEALRNAEKFISGSVRIESSSFDGPPSPVSEWDYQADMLAVELREALATYDKLSEVKHDTK